MVRSGRDGTHPVWTGLESVGDVCSELTVVGNSVETLEERENTRVGGLRGVDGLKLLDDNVVVSNDLPIAVQLLGRGIVSVRSVGEGTGLHALRILMTK